ncbi:PREDICTED: RNA-directed DNA polymerase from mobile element jockey-like [Nicrophorus vespilloides]|uniref:RNA-directed DNA polymerase from mobile element jockey-like n=1 Tax=Nicrophorus vespilloides TaxID=110193 RepID=A0ABM1MP79_NICVS|nr:PREDICTED: RNA-directed DNA polymerase from mobile element jockey-like [Nicrophorus vespilloides]
MSKIRIPLIRKADGSWARSSRERANVFAEHFVNVFQPFPNETIVDESGEIDEFLEAPFQMSLPIKPVRPFEVMDVIGDLKPSKAPGYDLITGRVMKELPRKAIVLLTTIFNSLMRTGYFSSHWKIAQLVVIPKTGKDPEKVTSYRPISLLPVMSKVFERLLLRRIRPFLCEEGVIPDHQFGFRRHHSTIEQIHRVTNDIRRSMEGKQYCSAVFLDITQAFDKVWHAGLLYKIKSTLPHTFYSLLKSFLCDRFFQVKMEGEVTQLYPIGSGVPQGSILGPVLYNLFTHDLPTSRETTIATYADDVAILSSNGDPVIAVRGLQCHLDAYQGWLSKWRIKVNETKSSHVTFTLRKGICPPVTLNNKIIPQADDAKCQDASPSVCEPWCTPPGT